jgi:hypothetical protein
MSTGPTLGNQAFTDPSPSRVMVLITEALPEGELLDELDRRLPRQPAGVILVAPAIDAGRSIGRSSDVDATIREARNRLERSREMLEGHGISALGEVGVSDPVVAAAEALRRFPAEHVLIVGDPYAGGLLERARSLLDLPVEPIATGRAQSEPIQAAHVGARAGSAGTVRGWDWLPRFSAGDRLAIAVAVVVAMFGIAALVLILISLIY